ncbi:MAG: Calx-beta domain-containing protein [Geminicoccaceae bacterium]
MILAASSMMVTAAAETIWLDDGRELNGAIIQANALTLIVKRYDSGRIEHLRRNAIKRISVEAEAGDTVTGQLVGWSEGVYEIDMDGRVALIRPGESPVLKSTSPPVDAVEDLAVAKENSDADLQVPAGADEASTATSNAVPTVDIKASPIDESEIIQAFDFKLSHKSEAPVTLLYITVDDSAIAGEDYEKSGGSVTIEPGETSTEVRISIIDDQTVEEAERFKLLVSTDPKVARLSDGYVSATINDND